MSDHQPKVSPLLRPRILGIILSLVMMGLTVYVLKLQNDNFQILSQSSDLSMGSGDSQASNYRFYVKKYKDTKTQLEETTRKLEAVTAQLDEVTAQLAMTKTMLTETQTMLAQAQSENSKFKQDLQNLASSENVQNVSELKASIADLKAKNIQTSNELNELKTNLRAFEADFSTMAEGKSLITLFRDKIKLVKIRMRYLEQQAYFARMAAQKERDRMAWLNGNNGFVIREASQKTKAVKKNFSIDVKLVP